MHENINTKEYWESRFSSNDWEEKRGRWQTESFARGHIEHLNIPSDFKGTILDFGCGLGDAIPVYQEAFPKAKLMGIDISQSAIDKCNNKYGHLALFMQGDYTNTPNVDVIIASNVFEHLSNDREIAKHLFTKCKSLYIIVPYSEHPLHPEHINTYDEYYFQDMGNLDYKIFPCAGWTPYGLRERYYNVYFKNVFRYLLGKPLRRRNMQIIYRFLAKKLDASLRRPAGEI
jgi:SAM-dependent methyltransferase